MNINKLTSSSHKGVTTTNKVNIYKNFVAKDFQGCFLPQKDDDNFLEYINFTDPDFIKKVCEPIFT